MAHSQAVVFRTAVHSPVVGGRNRAVISARSQAQHPCRPGSAKIALFPRRSSARLQTVRAAAPRDELAGADLAAWEECLERVTQLSGVDEEEGEKILKKGFGWGSKAYWGKSYEPVVPDRQKIDETLEFLSSQGFKEAEVGKVVKGFPEVLNLSIEDRLQPNIEYLEKEWRFQGRVMNMVVTKRPKTLGCTVDCRGNCAGDCTRCWANA